MRDDAIALLRTGAQQIRAKLEYARVCFGAAGSRGGEVALAEIKPLRIPCLRIHVLI
jgi:histidine phosphotransferase ChpT